jgi:hypothetical protein
MKAVDIRFFSSEENTLQKERKVKEAKLKKIVLNGYISGAGKLVFPAKIVGDLGVALENAAFKVGMQEGKRKAKSLYVVPADEAETNTFQFEKAAKSYTMSLPVILKKSGIDFKETKYVFSIDRFDYEGATALELQINPLEETPKKPYTGKPRGRKPKVQADAE